LADPEELPALRAENARLIRLLDAHGIEWRERALPGVAADTRGADRPLLRTQVPSSQPPQVRLSPAEKVTLFGRLFKGRPDVFPVRWESQTSGKSGYAPACANEWRQGVCEKPRIKCSACSHRELIPLSDAVLSRNRTEDGRVHAAVSTGLIWKPSAAARRLRAAMLRWRCCSS
jgi:hypothetical protein